MSKEKLAKVQKTNETQNFLVEWRKSDELARLVHGWNLKANDPMPEVICIGHGGLAYRFERESPDSVLMRRMAPGPRRTLLITMRRPYHG